MSLQIIILINKYYFSYIRSSAMPTSPVGQHTPWTVQIETACLCIRIAIAGAVHAS